MSVQSEITRLENAKAAIKAAIEGKGVTVPEATLLDGMASLIESIEAGGGGVDGSPFGATLASGVFVPSETITGSYDIPTGFSIDDLPSNLYAEFFAIVTLDEPFILDDYTKLNNSLLMSAYGPYAYVNNSYLKLEFTYFQRNSGKTYVSPDSYGRITKVLSSEITLSSLSYGSNYGCCLLAGFKYKWTLYAREKQ